MIKPTKININNEILSLIVNVWNLQIQNPVSKLIKKAQIICRVYLSEVFIKNPYKNTFLWMIQNWRAEFRSLFIWK